jgi:serine protease Do
MESKTFHRGALITGLALTTLFGTMHRAVAGVTAPVPAAIQPTANGVHQELGNFARLAKELKPAVVNIVVEKEVAQRANPLAGFFDDQGQQRPQFNAIMKGQGSGVIVSNDGYIVTNNHVVSNASTVLVTLSDGRELKARVIGTDPKTDIALVKVDANNLPYATLGNSDALDVGDWVMAIGNPFGLSQTVTVGVLSGKGRVIGEGPYDDFLQTDASINPGNSGGPLFNTKGEVVGINTAIIAHGQGIGFAVPVNVARNVMEQLKTTGYVRRGFMGVGVQPLGPKLKLALQLPATTEGALVSEVLPDGPGAKAGLHIEDVVTSINGHPVVSDRDLRSQAAALPIGATAQVSVLRDGRETTLPVEIVAQPGEGAQPAAPVPVDTGEKPLGIELAPLSPEIAAELRTADLSGVVVAAVAENSAAQRAGLQRGDIIRTINNRKFSDVNEFVQLVKEDQRTSAVAFLIERQGQTRFVVLDT